MVAQKKTKRNPTNAEIMLKLDEISKTQRTQGADLSMLKQWKRDQEIAKEAVAEYLKQNPQPAEEKNDQWLNRELVKTLGVALAVILALVTLIAQLKGLR